jgi:membrane protein required for colicin V production
VNIIDPTLLFLISLFALRGYFKGFFRESLSLLGIFAGFMVAVRYDERVGALLAGYWELSLTVLRAVAFVALFFVLYFTFSLAGWLLHRAAKKLFLQTFNRMGGIALGVGKGTAMLALVFFFLSTSSIMPQRARQRIEESYLAPTFYQLAERLIQIGKTALLPAKGSQAQEKEASRYFWTLG